MYQQQQEAEEEEGLNINDKDRPSLVCIWIWAATTIVSLSSKHGISQVTSKSHKKQSTMYCNLSLGIDGMQISFCEIQSFSQYSCHIDNLKLMEMEWIMS